MPDHSFLPLRRYRPAGDPFALRVSQVREGNPRGRHILYHARSARRARNNVALDYAKSLAAASGKPLIMAEWLDEPHLSPRIEAYLRTGSRHTAAEADVDYRFEPDRALIERARYVVTDEFPTLPVPPHATHLVDGNGLLPMRAIPKEQYSAKFFRDKAQRLFEQFWAGSAPAPLPLDFLDGYASDRTASSHLSAAIHFGHLGTREIAQAVLASDTATEDVEAFLEQLIIRRELSFNMCFYNPRYDSLDALPEWARKTLDQHRHDRRKPCYSAEELEAAATHDDVWNLAQHQLLACGTIHTYLRMLWGKKIIEWSETPEEAHRTMVMRTTATLSTAAIQTRTPASSGASASTTAPGRPSVRSSAASAGCRPLRRRRRSG